MIKKYQMRHLLLEIAESKGECQYEKSKVSLNLGKPTVSLFYIQLADRYSPCWMCYRSFLLYRPFVHFCCCHNNIRHLGVQPVPGALSKTIAGEFFLHFTAKDNQVKPTLAYDGHELHCKTDFLLSKPIRTPTQKKRWSGYVKLCKTAGVTSKQ